jgi:hypothetical protein
MKTEQPQDSSAEKPKLPETVPEAAKLLDIIKPGWYNVIFVNRLQMDSCPYCIIGQLFHTTYSDDFVSTLDTLFDLSETSYELVTTWPPFGYLEDCREQWINEILNRRQAMS